MKSTTMPWLRAVVLALVVGCGSGNAESAQRTASDTVFVEDFESGSLGAWQDGVDPAHQRIVDDSGGAQSGRHYLTVTYPTGAEGGWLTRFFLPGYDSLYVSLWVRFPPTWSGDTKLIALYGSRSDNQWSAFGQAGKCPTGSDFFATMLVSDWTARPAAGMTRFYAYYPAMAREPDGLTCWGRFGDGTETYTTPPMTRGVWHQLEFWVKLNSPGNRDGTQMFWVDGAPGGTWSALSLRGSPILRLNAVQLTFSRPFSAATPAQQLQVDHLVVTTRKQR